MRPVIVAAWSGLFLLAAANHAAACTCWKLEPFVWPSGLKDVPRLTHVLVIPGDWTDSVELVDLGPAVSDDELGQRLVFPGQAPEKGDLRVSIPERPRIIEVEHRPLGIRRFAEALVPRESLPAKHRILVVSTSTVLGTSAHPPERRKVRSVAGVFQTGELLTAAEPDPVQFVLRRRLSPDPYANGAACESSSGSAVLAPSRSEPAAGLFGVWDEESTSTVPRAFAVLRNGEIELGHTDVCEFASFGVNLQSGRHRFRIRPWLFSEFGRPVSIAFQL